MSFSGEAIIIGMPNSGKTTLFNNLTGLSERVGNYHGVTVDKVSGEARYKGGKFVITDLPGTYSLTPVTLEEKVTVNEIKNSPSPIVFVMEAATFLSAAKIINELVKLKKPLIIAVNMVKELTRRGGKLDHDYLQKKLGVKVIAGEFNKKKDASRIKSAIINGEFFVPKGEIFGEDFARAFTAPKYKKSKLDGAFLYGKFSILIFFAVCFLIFYITFGKFGIGKILSDLLKIFIVDYLGAKAEIGLKNIGASDFTLRFFTEAVVGGIGQVASFIPQIVILSGLITALELSGYLSRAALTMESVLYKSGLNGRSVFTMVMGFGCTGLAAAGANGLESETAKKRTLIVTSLIPCSAKIPVIQYLISQPVFKSRFLVLISLYFCALFVGIIELMLTDRFFIKEKRPPLVIELAPFRKTDISTLLKSLKKTAGSFIIKLSTVVFTLSLAVFALKSFDFRFRYVGDNYGASILYRLGGLINFLFAPIGAGDKKAAVAAISGLFAKEGIISALIALYGGVIPLERESLFAFSAFVFLYTPCFTATSMIAGVTSAKFALKAGVAQFIVALLFSYGAYFLLKRPIIAVPVYLAAGLAAFIYEKFYRTKKRKTE